MSSSTGEKKRTVGRRYIVACDGKYYIVLFRILITNYIQEHGRYGDSSKRILDYTNSHHDRIVIWRIPRESHPM